MKYILTLIIFFTAALSHAQLGITVSGDTLFSFDPVTNARVQMTKTIPSQTGQSGKVLSTNGAGFVWITTPEPTTISGSIAQSQVTNLVSDLVLKANAADVPTNTNQLVNGAGFLTGITSGSITTALGFTPYNATNPSGYISIVPAQTFASLTGKPTTLLGYGITDALSAAALIPYSTTVQANALYQPIGTYATGSGSASGTNTGDNATNTQYSGLAASKQNVITLGTTAQYFRGDLSLATFPSGSNYRTLVTLGADVTSNAGANTMSDVTGLSFAVTSGTTYRFYAMIPYTSAATTTGSRWSVNVPANTLLNYTSRYTLTATSQTINYATANDIPAASNATSLTAGNVAVIEGIVNPSANGTVVIRFASEIAASAIVAKAGATLEYW